MIVEKSSKFRSNAENNKTQELNIKEQIECCIKIDELVEEYNVIKSLLERLTLRLNISYICRELIVKLLGSMNYFSILNYACNVKEKEIFIQLRKYMMLVLYIPTEFDVNAFTNMIFSSFRNSMFILSQSMLILIDRILTMSKKESIEKELRISSEKLVICELKVLGKSNKVMEIRKILNEQYLLLSSVIKYRLYLDSTRNAVCYSEICCIY